jgi:hypothetical protein
MNNFSIAVERTAMEKRSVLMNVRQQEAIELYFASFLVVTWSIFIPQGYSFLLYALSA